MVSRVLVPVLTILAAAGILLTAPGALAQEGEPAKKEAPWRDQLVEMGVQLYQNSTVNVVNGLNLTREQAVKLRDLAKKAESRGIRRPVPAGALSPDLKKVADAFGEARILLRGGKEVPAEVERKIFKARELESRILRRGLRWNPRKRSCARCHGSPGEDEPARKWNWGTLPPHVKKAMAEDHIGIFGKRGSVTLYFLGREVDTILTENQKSVVSNFSCCLLPPKGMADPVRVGQAETAAWQVEMLEKARKCPKALWAFAKRRTLAKMEELARVKDPGLTGLQAAAMKKRVGDVLEKARSLSEFDFQLQKEPLCLELGLGPPENEAAPESVRCFMRAFFLLFPGAVKTYDALIRRYDERPELAPKDLEKEPGAGGRFT
jgi:hypothetical protein